MTRSNLLITLFAFSLISACGPMNKKLPASENGPQASMGTFGDPGVSKNKTYYMRPQLATASNTGAVLGDNTFIIEIAATQGLKTPSNEATVTITYEMPAMPEMGSSSEIAARQPDGTYTVTAFLSMAGKWLVTVKITDGTTQDDYVFQVSF